jgi:hypothetical protein
VLAIGRAAIVLDSSGAARHASGAGATGGAATPESRATLIDPDGRTHLFGPPAFALGPIGEWQSADGLARYPARMRLQIPAAKIDLTITPLLADQELTMAVRYWEGAVGVAGGRAVSGNGYLELTDMREARRVQGIRRRRRYIDGQVSMAWCRRSVPLTSAAR